MTSESGTKPALVLFDDDPETVEDAVAVLGRFFRCVGVSNPERVVSACAEAAPDAVLLDIMVGERPVGYELLERLRTLDPFLPVMMWSEDTRMETALEARDRGACGVLGKALSRSEIVPAVRTCLGLRRRAVHAAALAGRLCEPNLAFVHADPASVELVRRARELARNDGPLLITGESGVGRARLAREIHEASARSAGEFVSFDCAAVPLAASPGALFGWLVESTSFPRPGLVDAADGGTLLLKDPRALPADAQERLLALITTQRFRRVGGGADIHADVRFIVAASDEPSGPNKEAVLRDDLAERLSRERLRVRPLRERRGDIAPLTLHFAAARAGLIGRRLRPSDDAFEYLAAREWPGNVAELRRVVEEACDEAPGDELTAEVLRNLSDRAT